MVKSHIFTIAVALIARRSADDKLFDVFVWIGERIPETLSKYCTWDACHGGIRSDS